MRGAFLTILIIVFFCIGALVQAATFTDDTQLEFDAGTYSNTVWDTNHVELLNGQTSGTFTSQVFDAGDIANWSQIQWSETLSSVDKLVAVDAAADVWKFVDSVGVWSLAADDYNGADGNNATDMAVDGNENLWILNNQDVWKSTDAGASWTRVNDDYNGSETQNGLRIARDGSDNLYIAEADEDIWKSTDSGVNWVKQAVNINGGVGNIGGFVGVGSVLYAVDAAADVWGSTDGGITWTLVKDDYNGTDGNGVSYLTKDAGGNLYLIYNQDVWKSTDAGASWTRVNDDYNGSETQNAVVMALNSSGYLFISEGDEDIWRSIDDGASWTKQGTNVNGGNGNIVGLTYVSISTDITFAARSGNANPPPLGFVGSFTNSGGSDPSVSNAQYFQYQATFSTEDSGVTPELSGAIVTYAPISSSDTTAPAAVSDLTLSNLTNSAIVVSWTAPGDDGSTGTATAYDVRYSTSLITSGNFDSATQATGEPTPSVAGSSESMTVAGLSAGTTYYFALKISDEVPNTSAISNAPSGTTAAIPVVTAPSSGRPIDYYAGVLFSGLAYPDGVVTIFVENRLRPPGSGVDVETIAVANDGTFSTNLTNLLYGEYLFTLRATDKDGRNSGILAFNLNSFFTNQRNVRSENILMPPTIGFEKSSVLKNEAVKVLGYAAPQNVIELEVDGLKYKETKASQLGFWSFDIDTRSLDYGEHSVRVRQLGAQGKTSNSSFTRVFKVLQKPISKADLSNDGIVNISDWSIFLFRWGSDKEEQRSQNDINGDGKIDISDFSIFLQIMK